MAKHIQLTISEPCHESWNKMSTVEQGRFCDSCQKKVMDFTGMSDEKLGAFFRKPDISVCGRFRKEQLEADLAIPQKRIPWVKYLFQIALPAILFSYKGYAQQVKGKVSAKAGTLLIEQENKPTKKSTQTQELSKKVLEGRVVDAEGNGIGYASIWRENSSQGTAADSAGYFRLTINEGEPLILLKVSYIGYETASIQVDLKKGTTIPVIRLEYADMILGDVTVVAVKKRAPAIILKKTHMLIPAIMDSASGHFKMFPNPLAPGSSLNIELINKLKEGYYDMLVTRLDGKQAFQKKIWIDAEAKVMNIELPFMAAGNYIVSLKNKKSGKAFGEKLVIR
ncbi:MAG TPA: carboxypeptidase-like regulatory domain-containing protein [Chitinophagaceae bacterium]|nr:carboxypeptidase-like regulatory domain-containing protein [Chitinophagaceae bacterium]